MSLVGANGQLFGWAASTWLWLDQFGILAGDLMICLSLAGVVWAWLRRDAIRRWFVTNRFPVVGEEAADEGRWDAILFTISRPEVPVWVLRQQRPGAIALLATEESRPPALAVKEQAAELGIVVVGPEYIGDPDDPAESRERAARLIERLRALGHDRIAVDVTGGKTPMSLGAFMAAEEAGCVSLYVSTQYDPDLKKPHLPSARLRCISRPIDS